MGRVYRKVSMFFRQLQDYMGLPFRCFSPSVSTSPRPYLNAFTLDFLRFEAHCWGFQKEKLGLLNS